MKICAAFVLLAWSLLCGQSCLGQSAPLVMAFGAPNCTGSTGTTGCNANPNPQYYTNFLNNLASKVSGITLAIPWNSVDACTTAAGVSQPCTKQATTCSQETASGSVYYKWCPIDQGLLQYINSSQFKGKKIALIVEPVTDTGKNSFTPAYVFSTAWAGPAGVNSNPQDVIVCSAYPGDVKSMPSMSCPVYGAFSGTGSMADVAIWNVNGYSTGPSNACLPLRGGNLTCQSCMGGVTDFTGFPIVYEKPFMVAYQNFLAALASHYSPNGLNNGVTIAPYLAYVRAGMTEGGENQQFCTTVAGNPPQPTSPIASPPAGYIVNIDGTQYVATGSGPRGGGDMPGCSPSGCTTGPDGSVPGWYNAGPWTEGSGIIMWPGIKGQFGSSTEPAGYTDNGYLSTWADQGPTNDGLGYIALMTQFLQGLHASFPFDINAHGGPPAASNVAYADSEAIMSSANNIGFGMETLNVNDPLAYAQGTYSQNPFPTSLSDWAHNFITYPAPVHHLQTFFPGSPTRAAGYLISTIAGGSTATINCVSDCSIFTSSQTPGYPIYISGDSTANFNGITQALKCPGTGCPSGQLSFNPLDASAPNGTGGVVWAPDYLPIVVPFAVRQGATAFEIYECDLDYAFGLYVPPLGTSNQTIGWGTANGDCVPPSTSSPYSPVPGPDKMYQYSLSDATMGQPTSTSFRAGVSILSNANQF